MITIPHWIARLPIIRDKVFWPKITLRAHLTHFVVRYGMMPDGEEYPLGATVVYGLDHAREKYRGWLKAWPLPPIADRVTIAMYRSGMLGKPLRYCAPIQVEGTDFQPFPPLNHPEAA